MQHSKRMPGAKKDVYLPFTKHAGKTSVTKCACGKPEDDSVEMVMCTNRKCYTWQHSACVGFQGGDNLSKYECPLCSRGGKWCEDDDKRLMEEFELEVGKKEPRDRNDFFLEFLERYEIDKTTKFLARRFRELFEDFLLDETVDINRKAAVCIRGRLRMPEGLRETLQSFGTLKPDGHGGYRFTSKDKKEIRSVSAPRRRVTVKTEEVEEDSESTMLAAASLLAPTAPFSPAVDPAALPNDASAPQSPEPQDIPEYNAPQQDFDPPQDRAGTLAPQDTRTSSPDLHGRLSMKIRLSDFPELFPAHLRAAQASATPSPTPSVNRRTKSVTPATTSPTTPEVRQAHAPSSATAQDNRTPAIPSPTSPEVRQADAPSLITAQYTWTPAIPSSTTPEDRLAEHRSPSVLAQNTRTSPPSVRGRLSEEIRPSDFPLLFPAHLRAARVSATPSPTAPEDRRTKSVKRSVQNTWTPATQLPTPSEDRQADAPSSVTAQNTWTPATPSPTAPEDRQADAPSSVTAQNTQTPATPSPTPSVDRQPKSVPRSAQNTRTPATPLPTPLENRHAEHRSPSVLAQNTRTSPPGVRGRLSEEIRPSDFPLLFPAHLRAARVSATPSPTAPEDRRIKSVKRSVQNTQTPTTKSATTPVDRQADAPSSVTAQNTQTPATPSPTAPEDRLAETPSPPVLAQNTQTPATPSPTPSVDRQPKSVTRSTQNTQTPSPTTPVDRQADAPSSVTAQDNRTPAIPSSTPSVASPPNAAPPRALTQESSARAPSTTPVPPLLPPSTAPAPNNSPMDLGNPPRPPVLAPVPPLFNSTMAPPIPHETLAPSLQSSNSLAHKVAQMDSKNTPHTTPAPVAASQTPESSDHDSDNEDSNDGDSKEDLSSLESSKEFSEASFNHVQTKRLGVTRQINPNQYTNNQQMPPDTVLPGQPRSLSQQGPPVAHPNKMGNLQTPGPSGPPGRIYPAQYGTFQGPMPNLQPGVSGPPSHPVPIPMGKNSKDLLISEFRKDTQFPTLPADHPIAPFVPIQPHPSWSRNPWNPQTSGMPPVNPIPNEGMRRDRKRKNGASEIKLAVPGILAYNMLYSVHAFLKGMCKECEDESGLESLAAEFGNALGMREKMLNEKKVSYNTFFDNLEYVFDRLKDKSGSVKMESGEEIEIAEISVEIDAYLFWSKFWELLHENRTFFKEFEPLCEKVKELSETSGENVIRVEEIVKILRTPFLIYLM